MQFPPDRITFMKITLCVLCFFCATAAFAQSAPILSGQPAPIQMIEHPEHAMQHAMALETSLLGSSSYSYAQGEQPLAQFGTLKQETPLGDVARAYRKERATTAKPTKVMEN
jgi:hypothetical protein